MHTKQIQQNVTLFYPPEERKAADTMEVACKRSLALNIETWAIAPRSLCRLFVMTSCFGFLFAAVPWYARIHYGVAYLFYRRRLQRTWDYSGGWALRNRWSTSIGVKPPRLIETSDRSIGREIFVPDSNLARRVEFITCHELTHACSNHLHLPFWLYEGLAMVTVDRYFGHQTVRSDILRHLGPSVRVGMPISHRQLLKMTSDDITREYARGYWTTRMLAEARPNVLSKLLEHKRSHREIYKIIAHELDVPHRTTWASLVRIAHDFFDLDQGPACGAQISA